MRREKSAAAVARLAVALVREREVKERPGANGVERAAIPEAQALERRGARLDPARVPRVREFREDDEVAVRLRLGERGLRGGRGGVRRGRGRGRGRRGVVVGGAGGGGGGGGLPFPPASFRSDAFAGFSSASDAERKSWSFSGVMDARQVAVYEVDGAGIEEARA